MVGRVSPSPKIKKKRKKYFLVLKYQVFSEMFLKNYYIEKNIFVFTLTTKSLNDKKKLNCIFTEQNISKYVLACIFTLITSLLKPRELGQYFKKYPKNILFSFGI
jgi:hypothetical protein